MKKILLNCMPPTSPHRPGYSASVIKSFLMKQGYEVKIKYWNLALRDVINNFWSNNYDNVKTSQIIKDLMPFYNYYAVTRRDDKALDNIKKFLLKYTPSLRHIDDHLKKNNDLLCDRILDELTAIDVTHYSYIYVQSKFYKYQLVATGVLCDIVKKHYPNIITIIEAQEFSRKALAIMDSFDCYDFATWGEYELALYRLLEELEYGNNDYSSIPNIAYKDTFGTTHVSDSQIKEYININDTPYADFSDYIEQTNTELKNIKFPLEGGRGCHWNKCSFCYMNDGYKYRRKTPERMRDEILYYINTYHAQLFYYIDNDIVGHDIESFSLLLDYYKQIRKKHSLSIDFGEVIARDVNASIIDKMKYAGFTGIQIGYESTSDRMLEKINKKSHFAHLLLVCKWCFCLGIKMSPQNILRSMPFETDLLILDNILNLYYLRFLLSKDGFYHSMRQLCIVSTSRYYSSFTKNGKIKDWDYTPMNEFMIENFIKEEYKYDVFLMQTRKSNPLWELFIETERSLRSKQYNYEIIHKNGECRYLEKQGELIIKEHILSSSEQTIIQACDRKVISTAELKKITTGKMSDITLQNSLQELKQIGVIYISNVYDEIVSIISLTIQN